MNITEQAKEIFDNIKTVAPVVHNISNYITATDCANMTLACGGSPTMADDPEEVADISYETDGMKAARAAQELLNSIHQHQLVKEQE